MTDKKFTESPLYPKEVCDDLLFSCSVNAFKAHKSTNKALYQAEIDTLAKICATLLTYYNATPKSIIARMEAAIEEIHRNEIREIDYQINHLFHLRKQAPADTTYGEQEIIKITTKINALKELKALPIKDVIESTVHEAFKKAVKDFEAQIPADFNLSQYEYIPVEVEPEQELSDKNKSKR